MFSVGDCRARKLARNDGLGAPVIARSPQDDVAIPYMRKRTPLHTFYKGII